MHVRFHAPALQPGDDLVLLPPDEGAHASRVLRLRPGAAVRVFNGRGLECGGVVEEVDHERVAVRVGERLSALPEPRVVLTLVQAVLKGEAMDEVVRDAVMLGVAAIAPVVSAHVEVDVARLVRTGRVARWQRLAVASAKQCGRAVVPTVHEPVPLNTLLGSATAGLGLMLAEPTAPCRPCRLEVLPRLPVPTLAALAVGPEGGWDPAETEAASLAGWLLMTLGPRTLRADAVAVATIPLLQFLWGDL